jgi:hypothetical protein
MVVDEEKGCADDGEDGERPSTPEAIQETAHARILDDGHSNEEQGVDLVLSNFMGVVQKPGPLQVAAWPDFSVTPQSQKQSRNQEQDRPDIPQGAEIPRRNGDEDKKSGSNRRPSGYVPIEFRGALVGIHGCSKNGT